MKRIKELKNDHDVISFVYLEESLGPSSSDSLEFELACEIQSRMVSDHCTAHFAITNTQPSRFSCFAVAESEHLHAIAIVANQNATVVVNAHR